LDITLDKKGNLEAAIKITLKEADYQPKVEEKVKKYSKKANIKGFRQGKVPTSIIKKMYGKSIIAEEINHLVSHSLTDYIKDNNLKIIGEPLPDLEKVKNIDWDNQKEFEFEYSIGMVDDFAFDLSKKHKVKFFQISADTASVNETIENLKKQHGKMTNPEISEEGDSLFGALSQPVTDFIKDCLIDTTLVNKKVMKIFEDLKKGDVIKFDIKSIFTDDNTLASTLTIDIEEAKKLKGEFQFIIYGNIIFNKI